MVGGGAALEDLKLRADVGFNFGEDCLSNRVEEQCVRASSAAGNLMQEYRAGQ